MPTSTPLSPRAAFDIADLINEEVEVSSGRYGPIRIHQRGLVLVAQQNGPVHPHPPPPTRFTTSPGNTSPQEIWFLNAKSVPDRRFGGVDVVREFGDGDGGVQGEV